MRQLAMNQFRLDQQRAQRRLNQAYRRAIARALKEAKSTPRLKVPKSTTLSDWNQLVSKLGDDLRQGRDKAPPEQYRRAIEQYFAQISHVVAEQEEQEEKASRDADRCHDTTALVSHVDAWVGCLRHTAWCGQTRELMSAAEVSRGPSNVPPTTRPPTCSRADEWARVDAAVARGLAWLATQQRADGSFPTIDTGQPGVTSLCVLAFMAHGHIPGEGPYGRQLERAVEYILLLPKRERTHHALTAPTARASPAPVSHQIGTLRRLQPCDLRPDALGALWHGDSRSRPSRCSRQSTRRCARRSKMQRWPKDRPCRTAAAGDTSTTTSESDSDLSITGWYLMFLRSARNAGFDVPKERDRRRGRLHPPDV